MKAVAALGAALALVLALLAAAPAGADPAAWQGRFRLDAERSDPIAPLLSALEAPWFARMAAGRARPTLVVAPAEGGLDLRFQTPLGERREQFRGDGQERPGEDRFGRPFRQRSTWQEDSAMRVERRIALDDERSTELEITWRREAEALVNTVEVKSGPGAPLRVERVFARMPTAEEKP